VRSSERGKKLFLVEKGSYKGKPISVRGIQKRMEYYDRITHLKVSCHHLRHTMATVTQCRCGSSHHPVSPGSQQDQDYTMVLHGHQPEIAKRLLQSYGCDHEGGRRCEGYDLTIKRNSQRIMPYNPQQPLEKTGFFT
jgi:hypothetical protein